MKSIVVHRLRNGSVYRISAIGAVFGMIPLFTVFGILASMNLFTLTWNNEAVTGPRALIVGPLMGVLFSAVCTALFGSVIALGLWIYSKFRPLTLEYEETPTLPGVLSTDA